MRMDIPTGYSSIVRTLVDGKASDDLYYDPEMRPVRCSSGYYGLHREYDADGQNSSLKEAEMMSYSFCQKKCRYYCHCQIDKQFADGEMLSS